ncbi:MAG: cupin domain-containing protein [Myxococcota bacterium]
MFAPSRTPESKDLDAAFCELSPYREGAIFLGHWAGRSEWEIHRQGDEVVMVIDGATTLTMLIDDEEIPHPLQAGQLIVVPKGVWHRFETPDGVKVMTVTPQPTEHSVTRPGPV